MAQGTAAHFANRGPLTGTGSPHHFRLGAWKIGTLLTACFAAILLLMIVGDVIAVLQLDRVETRTRRFYQADQKSLAIMHVYLDVVTFRETLTGLAHDQDPHEFASRATVLRDNFLRDVTHAQRTLSSAPDVSQDPTILIRLETVRAALPSQVDAMLELVKTGDWQAVRFRLAGQVPPLIGLSSSLVADVEQEVAQERAQALESIQRARRQLYLLLPLTALLILFMAAMLGWYTTRRISRPLAQLDAGAQALARGEFGYKVEVKGSDELADLARAFNYAARQLHKLYDLNKRSEAYLTEAQRLTHTGSWACNLVTREVFHSSDENARLYGFDPSKGAIPFDGFYNTILAEDEPALRAKLENAIRAGVGYDVEYRIRRSDGAIRFMRGIGHHNPSQEIGEYVGITMDITERKRAEEERERLRQLEADLAHIDRVSTLGEMAASLAHEIKQPIAAAITSANSCMEWLAHEPPNLDRARAAAARIDKYGNRAAEIIDHIRSFYRKSPPQRELVDVNGIIQEMLTLLKGEANRYSVAMRTELAAELPEIMADRVQLQQVFMNLMLNGIEAMEDSGGELTVKSQLQDGQLRFSVGDTGVGLPTEKMELIFSAFFTTKPHGSGMGLAISRSIVESHGGRLWATASGRQGTTFHFTLATETTETSPSVA
jgi:signal transduction histidine kinase/HAMP domain-containing protein